MLEIRTRYTIRLLKNSYKDIKWNQKVLSLKAFILNLRLTNGWLLIAKSIMGGRKISGSGCCEKLTSYHHSCWSELTRTVSRPPHWVCTIDLLTSDLSDAHLDHRASAYWFSFCSPFTLFLTWLNPRLLKNMSIFSPCLVFTYWTLFNNCHTFIVMVMRPELCFLWMLIICFRLYHLPILWT